MKKAGLLALGTIPGVVFGYAVLAGILMKRITPVPIVAMPDKKDAPARRRPAREPASA